MIRIADKIDKLGVDGVRTQLATQLGLTPEQITVCLDLAQIRGTDPSVVDDIGRLGAKSACPSA